MRKDEQSSRRTDVRLLPTLAAAVMAISCSAQHMAQHDGDAGADDGGPDADADLPHPLDGGDSSDDGDVADVDADDVRDGDVEGGPPGWVLSTPPLTDIDPLPGGDLLVAWARGLARLDAQGELVWSKSYGGGTYYTFSTSVSPEGRIFVAAVRVLGPDRPFWLAEVDGDGEILRQRSLEGQHGGPLLTALTDGTVAVCVLDADRVPQVARVSLEDGVVWAYRFRRMLVDLSFLLHVRAGGDDGVFLVATYGGDQDAPVVLALGPEGDIRWARSVRVYGRAFAPTEDGGVLLGGGPGVRLVKLRADGNLGWTTMIGRSDDFFECRPYCNADSARALALGPAGDMLVVGLSTGYDTYEPYSDMLALRASSRGAFLWATGIRPFDGSDASAEAAAALDDGRSAFYGRAGFGDTTWLASLSVEGGLGTRCDALSGRSLDTSYWTTTVTEVTDYVVSDGTLELTDVSLAATEAPIDLETVCP